MTSLAAAAVLAAFAACGAVLVAQSPAPATTPPPAHTAHPAHRPVKGHKLTAAKPSPSTPAPAAVAAVQTPPPEPPKPDWPANDKPVAAKVTWDIHGLTVEATNSSLGEILKEVATQTGARLEGKTGDERVFGSYGPGPARDIIKQLLDGTAYNVLMVGDQGEGTPRQIVLSNRPSGPVPTGNAQNNNEEEVDNEPQPQQMPSVPIVHNAFTPPGMPPEQNQQSMEERRAEMEQRRQEMRQQQQEQQQEQQQQQPQTPPQ